MEQMYCREHDANQVRVFSEKDSAYGSFKVMTVEEAISTYGDIRYLFDNDEPIERGAFVELRYLFDNDESC